MFAFTSMSVKINTFVNDQPSLYVFKIKGHYHHLMGSLLPVDGESPKFAQLYMFGTAHKVANRLLPFAGNSRSSSLDENIIMDLLKMLDETNKFAKLFCKARDKTHNIQSVDYKLRLHGKKEHDSHQYNDPTSNDIDGLVVGDIGDLFFKWDIIIECFSGSIKRISKLHPKFMALQYSFLFPYSEDGYSSNIMFADHGHEKTRKRLRVQMRAYYAYLINESPGCDNTIIKGGCLYR